MPKKKHHYKGIDYASAEEVEFKQITEALDRYGFIEREVYQPAPFILAPKCSYAYLDPRGKKKTRSLFRVHQYTADWMLEFNASFAKKFPGHPLYGVSLDGSDLILPGTAEPFRCYIDVKGAFNPNEGDRILSIHQKLVWGTFHEYVNRVVPVEFCVQAGVVPDAMKWMKNRKKKTPKKKFTNVPTFENTCQTPDKLDMQHTGGTLMPSSSKQSKRSS